jgi:hypothetical protein
VLLNFEIFLEPSIFYKSVESLNMEAFLVQTENEEQAKLVKAFLEKHQLKSHVLSEEDKEDIVPGRLMEETDYSDVIDRYPFLIQLRG